MVSYRGTAFKQPDTCAVVIKRSLCLIRISGGPCASLQAVLTRAGSPVCSRLVTGRAPALGDQMQTDAPLDPLSHTDQSLQQN